MKGLNQKARNLEHEQMVAGYAPSSKKKHLDADKRRSTIVNQFIGHDPNAPP